jgi:hypothetical protein
MMADRTDPSRTTAVKARQGHTSGRVPTVPAAIVLAYLYAPRSPVSF